MIAQLFQVWMRVSGAEERMKTHPGEFHRLAKERPLGEAAQTIELGECVPVVAGV